MGRNYIMSIKSIIITIVVSVLLDYCVSIFFGFFMPVSRGVNNKTPPSTYPHLPLPYQAFIRIVCCLTKNT